jgi:hypothetical protein
MARNPEIEKILEAWLHWESCPPQEKAKSESQLNSLLDDVVRKGGGQITRDQILDSLFSQYKDFRKEKRRSESLAVAQAAMKQ